MPLLLYNAESLEVAQRLLLFDASSQTGAAGQRLMLYNAESLWHSADLPSTISVSGGPDITYPSGVEPFDTITLNATSPDSPDLYEWEQVSGPPVLLLIVVDPDTVTYLAPPIPDYNGADLVFRVTASKAGTTPAVDTVTHHLYPHTVHGKDEVGNLVPIVAAT